MRSRSASTRRGELGARCRHPGFFDTLDHGWLIRFIEHRVADRRVVRLIQKWLAAACWRTGNTVSEVGTVQGGSVSPLLANIYLHYVFDLWVQRWRTSRRTATWSSVRFADDFVVGFQHRRKPNASSPSCASVRAVRADAASRQDAAHRIRSLRGPESARRATGSRRPSTFWASRIAARRRGRDGSRCCGRRCARGGRRSCER